jgi:hypothetical protein
MRIWIALMLATWSLLPGTNASAAEVSEIYSSVFEVTGRNGRDYRITIEVQRALPAAEGTPASVIIERICGRKRCPQRVFVQDVGDDLTVDAAAGTATLSTKFGGKDFEIGWALGEPEPVPESSLGYRRYAVTANNSLNVGCYGVGEQRQSLSLDDAGAAPEGKPFPEKMPHEFGASRVSRPRCTTESP